MTSESTRPPKANAAFSMDDFAKALEQDEYNYRFQRGQVVKGKPFEYTSEGVYVDIGGKSAGFVPLDEASFTRFENLANILPLQEEQEFLIIREQDAEGQVLLSRRQLTIKKVWNEMSDYKASGASVQMRVNGVNRGGVIGDVNGLRAFIPRSHLMEKDNLDSLVGQLLTAVCIEVDPDKRKLVLSQRDAARAQAIKKVAPGTLAEGTVISLKPYGAFIDLGDVTGLLHIKQFSSMPLENLNSVLKVGQTFKVVVIEVDEFKNRISLATKMLERYPGEMLEKMETVMIDAEERLAEYLAKEAEQISPNFPSSPPPASLPNLLQAEDT